MADIVTRLHADHANMLSLLNILQAELEKIGDAENADFEIMHDVLHYLTRYSDAIHHPAEDLVYSMLSERSPKARSDLAPIPKEHIRIEQESRELLDIIAQLGDSGVILRTDILSKGNNYVSDLRRHIMLEEKHLFPMIRELLHEDDLKTVQDTLSANEDPIFGSIVDADFKNLYQHIQQAL